MQTFEFEVDCLLCNATIEVTLEAKKLKESYKVGIICDDCFEDEEYEDPTKFGRFINALRIKYGWNRDYLCQVLGFSSETSVLNFETGHTAMKQKYISRFCKKTPDKITVPVLFAMFEVKSLKPPCRCVCHYDMLNTVPNIYDDDGRCRLCDHDDGDCNIVNGLWFEKNKENFYDEEKEEEAE